MRTKYRIKQEVLKNGDSLYTIQKRDFIWWKTYLSHNGYGGCYYYSYDNLQEAIEMLKKLHEQEDLLDGIRVKETMYIYKEVSGE